MRKSHFGQRVLEFAGRRWRSLRDDNRGAINAFVAAALVPMLVAAGVGIDAGRAYLVRARLSQALDAAALAGGKAIYSQTRDADIRKYFTVNFPDGYMGSTVSGPNISIGANGSTVTVTASATIDTLLLKIVGQDSVTVGASSVVERLNRSMELVLTLDVTGSMSSNNKIGALRNAATDLVNILYGSREEMETFWIGIVPYAVTVNVGSDHSGWLQPGSLIPANYSPGTWKGCVEARNSPYEEASAETLPSGQGWKPYFWATTKNEVMKVGTSNLSHPSQYDNEWPSIDESSASGNNAKGPNLGCPSPAILPLQKSKTAALNAISSLVPWSRGGTMSNIGLAWTWRVLSPAWRGMWAGDPALPLDYNTPLMDKVVVLLTDGVNQWYDYPGHAPGCAGFASCPTGGTMAGQNTDYSSYGRLKENRLGTTNEATATSIINSRMSSLCTAMKAKNIIIYTIVLQENDAATQNLFRNCATQPDYFFVSPTANDLAAIFRQIGTNLSNLRLAR